MYEKVVGTSTSLDDDEAIHKTSVSFGVAVPAKQHKKKSNGYNHAKQKRALSRTSKMYDVDGDGQLDEAELAMRNLDTSGRGHLTNDKVYTLMREHFDDQRQLFKMKKVLIGLSILVLLLTLSNLGTSFAAAYLAKDTTVNDKEELVSSDTKTALSTQATAAKFGVEPLPEEEEEEQAARRLDCITDNNDRFDNEGENEILCATKAGGKNGFAIQEVGTRENGSCGTIQTQCERGHYVDIYRVFSNKERVTINICGPTTTVTENAAKGLVSFTTSGVAKINMQYTKYGCKFDGQDLTQRTGEVCDTGSDCARKHKCYQPSEATMGRCRSDCKSRFRKNSDQRVCNDSCFNTNTCELINKFMVLAGTTPEPSYSPTPRPTTARPSTKSPTSRPTISSAPSKSPEPSMSPTISSVPTLTPCPEQYTVTKTYDTNDKVTCGGENKSPSDANCQSSNDGGLVWYYSGKKWKKIGTCTKNGFVNFSVFS